MNWEIFVKLLSCNNLNPIVKKLNSTCKANIAGNVSKYFLGTSENATIFQISDIKVNFECFVGVAKANKKPYDQVFLQQ